LWSGGQLSVLMGNGDGTFQARRRISAGDDPVAIASADLDEDGLLDLVVANGYPHNLSVLRGGGDGSFGPRVVYDLGDEPTSLIVTDASGDGILDVVSSNRGYASWSFYFASTVHPGGGVSVLVGRGDGTFEPAVNYYFPKSDFRSVAAEDFDGDGDHDLVLANANGANVVRNNTRHDFTPQPGDANLDGRFDQLDIVLVLQAGRYLTGEPATWDQGDWNGDRVFDQLDIVAVLQAGRYLASADVYPDVLSVELVATGNGIYRVSVTLSSPYDTPSRYADAWRILTLDGTVLGARVLTHDHQVEQPFTRTLSGVVIPEDVTEVTVEGRDQISGWGGATVTVPVPR
jgi:hypothetical protein